MMDTLDRIVIIFGGDVNVKGIIDPTIPSKDVC